MKHKAVVSMVCITVLMGIALFKGLDGAMLTAGCSVLAGLGGYAVAKKNSP